MYYKGTLKASSAIKSGITRQKSAFLNVGKRHLALTFHYDLPEEMFVAIS